MEIVAIAMIIAIIAIIANTKYREILIIAYKQKKAAIIVIITSNWN
jgi:hypothetical protein